MLDQLEKIAKIVSLVAIPIALWWLGTQYQSADTRAKTAVEYVKLSITIIENQNEADPALLNWASETLNYYSDIKFSEPLAQAIASGHANVSPAAAAGGWYAIVGSLKTVQEAKNLVQRILPKLPDELREFELQIYKTEISGLYAVTIGGEASKSVAVLRATAVRDSGLVPDAFAQKDRGWSKVEI